MLKKDKVLRILQKISANLFLQFDFFLQRNLKKSTDMWLHARYPAALACILHKCKVLGKLPEVMKLHDSIYALIYEIWSSDYAVVCMHFCNIDNTRASELALVHYQTIQ